MTSVLDTCKRAAAVKQEIGTLGTKEKNRALLAIADAWQAHRAEILAANQLDIDAGRKNGLNEGLIDRLTLGNDRIDGVADGCRQVAALPDPIGEVTEMKVTPNGLKIGKKRVPMGVIGIIYEARPNVTVDAAALCFKAGSACVLRGGKEAFHSNQCLMGIMRDAIASCGLSPDILNLIEDTTHEGANVMMQANGLIDVLIPRGSARLIQAVVKTATVPVIETGVGNCHIYVDASASLSATRRKACLYIATLRRSSCRWQNSVWTSIRSSGTAVRKPVRFSETTSFRQPMTTTARSTSITRFPAKSSTRRMPPLTISTTTTPDTRRQSSRTITSTPSVFWIGSMPPLFMSTLLPALPTAANLALAQKSASPPKSCTPAAPWV